MAAKLNSLFRGAGRNALDLPVAGLSALAAAFAAFAIPQDILSRAVVATGLPSILPAAQPPLGLTARVAIAGAGAALVFCLVFLALRLLDRSGSRTDASEDGLAGPRVRRRDGHPDAPMPRPISAARDLGEPAPPRAPRAEVPLWLDEAVPTPPAFGAPPEPEAEPEPALLLDQEADPEPEPWRAPEPVVFPEPVFDARPAPAAKFEIRPEPQPLPDPEPLPEPEPEPAPAPAAITAPAPAPVLAPAPVPVPAPPRVPQEMPTSIAGLMERLEQGLARRRAIEPAPASVEPPHAFPDLPEVAAAPAAPVPSQVFPDAPEPEPKPEPFEAADDRLQSAIASLQRLAARSA